MVFSSIKHGAPRDPLQGRRGLLLGAAALALAVFVALAWAMLAHQPLLDLDHALAAELHAHARTAGLAAGFLLLTHWHSTPGLLLMAAAAAGWLIWRQQARWLPVLLASVPGGMLLNVALKHGFQRTRPVFEDPVVLLHTYSFPSGHALGAAVWYGWLGVYLASRCERPGARAAVWAGALGMAAAVGFSRVYLGAHFLSDVLAGWAEGIAWLCLCLALQRWLAARKVALAGACGAGRYDHGPGR